MTAPYASMTVPYTFVPAQPPLLWSVPPTLCRAKSAVLRLSALLPLSSPLIGASNDP